MYTFFQIFLYSDQKYSVSTSSPSAGPISRETANIYTVLETLKRYIGIFMFFSRMATIYGMTDRPHLPFETFSQRFELY